MKKHNTKFATRWAGAPNKAALSHTTANDKQFQMAANGLLKNLFWRFFMVQGFITRKVPA